MTREVVDRLGLCLRLPAGVLELESGTVDLPVTSASQLETCPDISLSDYILKLKGSGLILETLAGHGLADSVALPGGATGTVGQSKAYALQYRPPSFYPGKMRLFLQALYGRKLRTTLDPLAVSLTTDGLGNVNGAAIRLDGELLHPFGQGNACLAGGKDYDWQYWLINPSWDYFAVFPIQFSAAGRQLRTYLQDGNYPAELETILETFLLSSCNGLGDRFDVTLGNGAISGSPFDFGWHCNSTGTEYILLTHQFPTNWHRYRVSLNLNTFTASSAYTTGAYTLSKTRHLVWAMDRGSGAFSQLTQEGLEVYPTGTCKLYAYYDSGDVLREFSFVSTQHPAGQTTDSGWASGLGDPDYYSWCGVSPGADSRYRIGFAAGGYTTELTPFGYDCKIGGGYQEIIESWSQVSQSPDPPAETFAGVSNIGEDPGTCSGFPKDENGNPPGLGGNFLVIDKFSTTEYDIQSRSGTTAGNIFFAISGRDCCAVYGGYYTTGTYSSVSTQTNSGNMNLYRATYTRVPVEVSPGVFIDKYVRNSTSGTVTNNFSSGAAGYNVLGTITSSSTTTNVSAASGSASLYDFTGQSKAIYSGSDAGSYQRYLDSLNLSATELAAFNSANLGDLIYTDADLTAAADWGYSRQADFFLRFIGFV